MATVTCKVVYSWSWWRLQNVEVQVEVPEVEDKKWMRKMVKYVTTVSQEEVKRRTRKQELWLCFFVFVVLTISAVVGCSVLSKTSDPGGQKIRTPQLSKGIEINTSIEVNR